MGEKAAETFQNNGKYADKNQANRNDFGCRLTSGSAPPGTQTKYLKSTWQEVHMSPTVVAEK
jgi:hypothetical protein